MSEQKHVSQETQQNAHFPLKSHTGKMSNFYSQQLEWAMLYI